MLTRLCWWLYVILQDEVVVVSRSDDRGLLYVSGEWHLIDKGEAQRMLPTTGLERMTRK